MMENWSFRRGKLSAVLNSPEHSGNPVARQMASSLGSQAPVAFEFAPIDVARFGFYPVVDSVTWVKALLEWGVTTLQLRLKRSPNDQVKAEICESIKLGHEFGAQLFINDHWQLAIELGAYGVHLGQEDVDNADLAAIHAAGLRLGLSTHDPVEAARAAAFNPSYIALGHVFPTQTKDMPSTPQGIFALRQQAELFTGVFPTVAIGGLKLEHVPSVLAAGVDSVAVVTAVTEAEDPEQIVKDFIGLTSKPKRTIPISVNGESISCVASDLKSLIDTMVAPDRRVAVALNGEVIARSIWSQTQLHANVQIDVFESIAGG